MNQASPRILFLADPWETLDYSRDSTLYLAEFAMKQLEARCFWATPDDVFYEGPSAQKSSNLFVQTLGELSSLSSAQAMLKPKSEVFSLSDFHSIHWRKDPPVDLSTYRLWSLLAACEKQLPPFYNPPKALLAWNEKFSALRFPRFAVPSLVGNREDIRRGLALKKTGKRLLVKPSGDAASRGVRFLEENLNSNELDSWPVIQEFQEEILKSGETRAFIIGGKFCGALCKWPNPKQPIIDFDADPSVRPRVEICVLTSEQESAMSEIEKALTQDGIHLASVDFIGSSLLEINVTSVGLIRWYDEKAQMTSKLSQAYWNKILN